MTSGVEVLYEVVVRDTSGVSVGLTPRDPKFGSQEVIVIGFNIETCHITCPFDGEF
jgi:hypothetical protein